MVTLKILFSPFMVHYSVNLKNNICECSSCFADLQEMSSKLIYRQLLSYAEPGKKQSIMMTVLEDAS